jgi:hypothetical protein
MAENKLKGLAELLAELEQTLLSLKATKDTGRRRLLLRKMRQLPHDSLMTGHGSSPMTARYTGEIPVEQVPVVTQSNLQRLRKVIESFRLEEARASYNGSIEASQASDVGSIPIARSIPHDVSAVSYGTNADRIRHEGKSAAIQP